MKDECQKQLMTEQGQANLHIELIHREAKRAAFKAKMYKDGKEMDPVLLGHLGS